jgi:PAS domain S-box-containing protein
MSQHHASSGPLTGLLPEESLEELYDQAPCGYLTTTTDGVVVRVNDTFLRWTGLRREDLVGVRRFSELLTSGGRIFHETHYAPLLRMQGSVREVALDIVRADSTTLPALVSAVVRPGSGGEPDLVRTTVFDATHRRSYEQQLLSARRSAEASEARMRSLQEVVERLAAATSSHEVIEVAASAAGPALAARGSTVWMLEPTAGRRGEHGALVLVAWTGLRVPTVRRIPVGSALPHAACARDGTVHVVDPPPGWSEEPPADLVGPGLEAGPARRHGDGPQPSTVGSDLTTAPGTSRMAFVPLVSQGAALGVLAVELPPDRDLAEAGRSLLGTLGRQAGVALERARLHDSAAAAARRSSFLLRAATVLAAATDFRDTLERLAEVAVPALADICLIDIVTDSKPVRMVGRHGDPARQAFVDEVVRDYSPTVDDGSPAMQAIAEGKVVWQPRVDAEWLRSSTRDGRHLDLAVRAGFSGFISVPLVTCERILGAITFGAGPDRPLFTEADVDIAVELGQQVALVAARAERFEAEYRASHVLQAGLLPPAPPPVPGLAVGVKYVPASRFAEVGGDFYDVLPLPDGSVAFAVGDVIGHDLVAAATMGQIRSVYRAMVAEGASPAAIVDRMQAGWPVLGLERMATAVFGRLWPGTGAVRLASAGHPSPLLVRPDGAELLPVVPTTPLGIRVGPAPEWSGTVPAGCTLVLYTDGLIENRRESLAVGLERLRATAAAAAAAGTREPLELCDVLLGALAAGHRGDDIALLAIARPEWVSLTQPDPEPSC